MNAGAQQFQRSSISVGFSISRHLIFLVKMLRFRSLAVPALRVNPIASFRFVWDLDYYIDHAGLRHTQDASKMALLCLDVLL